VQYDEYDQMDVWAFLRSLLKTTLEGQIQGKKGCGRPRTMLLYWLWKTEEATIGYEELKMSAQDKSCWRQ